MAEDRKTITLTHPIDVAGAPLKSVVMRRPLVRDLRAAQHAAGVGATGDELEIALFSNLCEISPDDWELMDLGDYRAVQEAYEGFLSRA